MNSSKWDNKYRDAIAPGNVCHVLSEYSYLLPSSGSSLDIACGLGANALFLAEKGLQSFAYDNSSLGLEKLAQFAEQRGLRVSSELRDVEQDLLGEQSFDVIVVSYFLYRPLCEVLVRALNPGGFLFYQTFTEAAAANGGPSNKKFLLKSDELLSLFSDLSVQVYQENSTVPNQALFVGKKL